MYSNNLLQNKYTQSVNNLIISEKKIYHQINILRHSMCKGDLCDEYKRYYNDISFYQPQKCDEIFLNELDNYIDWLVNGRY